MKIAVSAKGKTLDSELDPRFGRALCFIVTDLEHAGFEVMENRHDTNSPGGAGIQAAKTVADQGVGAVLTGNCGPKAQAVLEKAGIKVLTGFAGTVREALEQYNNGNGPALKGNFGHGYQRGKRQGRNR